VFTPSPAEYWRALSILDAYDRATSADQRGAVMLDEEMIDEASRKMALMIAAKGEAVGLPKPGLQDSPGPERVKQPVRQRKRQKVRRPDPYRVIGVIPRDQGPADHRCRVIPDVQHASCAARTAYRTDQPADGDRKPGLLTDLPHERRLVRLAGLNPPAGYRPEPLARLVAALDKQQPPQVVLDHGAHAGYDGCCHDPKSKYGTGVVVSAVCPRCGRQVHAPTAWSSAWRCDLHGEIYPLFPARRPSKDSLDSLLKMARVPVWLPWPLPQGWLVCGFTGAGDERTGTRGSAVALSGPNPLGGPADLLIVAEEPGVGLGAGLAGLPGPDPGDGFATGQPNATVKVANHEAPLWLVESDHEAVFAGEVAGSWLWVVLWPDTAGALLIEPLPLRDLRSRELDLDLPFGALSPRLPG